MSNINPALLPETTGENAGKILVDNLREQLATARDEVTALENAMGNKISQQQADERYPLLVAGKVAASQLPSFVDDVLEFPTFATLPVVGEGGKIYVTLNNDKTYRWSGSAYVEISASPGSTDAVPEGANNLYHTAARVRAVVLTGLSLATAAVVEATDTVLSAIGKLQAQINGFVNVSRNWVAQGQLIGTTANGGVTIASNIITLNMGAYNSFDIGTLAAATYTFAAPTGLQAGVSFAGDIEFTTPATGTVSFIYNGVFKFRNGTAPTINTSANADNFFEFKTKGTTIVRLTNADRWA